MTTKEKTKQRAGWKFSGTFSANQFSYELDPAIKSVGPQSSGKLSTPEGEVEKVTDYRNQDQAREVLLFVQKALEDSTRGYGGILGSANGRGNDYWKVTASGDGVSRLSLSIEPA